MPLGVLIAIIPSLIGGAIVAEVIHGRHSEGSDADEVQRHLRILFAVVAAVIDIGSLVATFTYGDAYGLLILLVGNASGLPVLWLAAWSISRAWARPG